MGPEDLDQIGSYVRPVLDARFRARETAITQGRLVVRASANAIRALHRDESDNADELIAEAENYAADQEASRIRKLYAAYLQGVEALQKGLGRPDGSTDTAILQFLVQQQWASAYEKNQEGQNTMVIQSAPGQTSLALPAPASAKPSEGE